MKNTVFSRSFVRRRMASSHLGIILLDFAEHLQSRGYRANSIRQYCQVIEHFSRWLAVEGIKLKRIDRLVVRRFLGQHLPECRCPPPAPRSLRNCHSALGRLLEFLAQRGLLVIRDSRTGSQIERLVESYDVHLDEVRGLADSTRCYRRRYAREFLRSRLRNGRLCLGSLLAADLAKYVQQRAGTLRASSLRVLTVALRDLLRFLQLAGLAVEGCERRVPTPSPWPCRSLPEPFSTTELTVWLRGLERRTAVGRRDYAMALCLVQLGLRVQEVAALSLDDLCHHAGGFAAAPDQQRREHLVPLPENVARAILNYLERGRPQTTSNALFVRHRIPWGCALKPHHVRGAMRRAMTRGGLGCDRVHLLRHSFATGLCQRGVGLKAAADLLGHRSLDTAAQYTRVHLQELRQAALPWPEGWR